MKKMLLKNTSKIVAIMILVSVFSVTSYATTYNTSISMSFRSTLTGTGRSFTGSTHRIDNTLSSRSGSGDNYCDFSLQERVGTSYQTQLTRTQNLRNIGTTYSSTYSNQSQSGTFRYYISNRYLASDYRYTLVDDFDCNQVTLSSN